uniref:Uncharacterized protein n=1 Tax=Siphoviridae sp. ctMRT7 TaxID=2827855 RepID=A0A8S5SSX0_9CAUD|nr:MAG TPA: hypothetical protein [Siphoviridae sp. ctMRT7]
MQNPAFCDIIRKIERRSFKARNSLFACAFVPITYAW